MTYHAVLSAAQRRRGRTAGAPQPGRGLKGRYDTRPVQAKARALAAALPVGQQAGLAFKFPVFLPRRDLLAIRRCCAGAATVCRRALGGAGGRARACGTMPVPGSASDGRRWRSTCWPHCSVPTDPLGVGTLRLPTPSEGVGSLQQKT